MDVVNKKYKVIDYIIIPFKIEPMIIICEIILRIINSLIPSILVIVTSKFINTAGEVLKNGNLSKIYIPLMGVIFIIALSWAIETLSIIVNIKVNLKISEEIHTRIVEKRNRLAYKHIENEDTWELIKRVGKDPSEQIINGFENLLEILEYIIKITSLIMIIITQVWWVALVILIITIPLFKLSFMSGKAEYDTLIDVNKYSRRADYLSEIISSRESVEERSLFGYTPELVKKWHKWFEIARKMDFKSDRRIFIKMKTASILQH